MQTVTSTDGTTIGYDRSGAGPAVVLVAGALQYRAFDQGMARLAELLSPHFTVFNYDRRGRGDSTDTQPYAFSKEIEDLEAVIQAAGGSAFVYGISSGASLAMEAAVQVGSKIQKLALYEPPYNDDANSRQAWKDYTRSLQASLNENRRGDAVALFMKLVGAADDQINGMRQAPVWPVFEAVAPTLAYDHVHIMGEEASVPVQRAARVQVHTLILTGGASFPFMETTAKALAAAIPNSQRRVLDGQTHDVSADALAPVLIEFFKS